MKQQKEHWVKTLFSFAGPCKGKMTLSVLCAILSVAGGFVPFWAVYEILLLFINRTATLNNIMLWCLVGVGGYLIRVICFGISTILAHISAYTILEGIRLKIANRLMRAPLGEVMGRRIGYLKNIIMDKVEDLEPPLAHMIPELTSNLLLPVAIFIWLLAIDWRLGLAVLIAPVLAMIPMFFLMRNYNSQYFNRQQVQGEAFQAWGAITYAQPLTEQEMRDYELRPSRENLDIRRQMDAQAQVVGKWEDAHHAPEQKRLTWFYPDFGSYVVKEYVTPEQLSIRARGVERQAAAKAHKQEKGKQPIAEQLKAAQREAQEHQGPEAPKKKAPDRGER